VSVGQQSSVDHPGEVSDEQALATLGALARLGQGTVTGVILVQQNRANPPHITQLRPTTRAGAALTDVVRAAADVYTDREAIRYDPAMSAGESQVMWIGAAKVPLLSAMVAGAANLSGLPLFDPKKNPLADLQLAAMRAVSTDIDAVFVQSLRGNQIVAQSRQMGVIVRRGFVDVPPSGELLLFSRDVAVIVAQGIAFFTDRRGFERLSGYLDELRRNAADTFLTVTQGLRIEGFEQMATAVTGSPAMLGKMASIQRKIDEYPAYRNALTMPRLVAFARAHPEYAVDVAGEGNSARLVFRNDPQHRFKILKLLDDDYLRSELTSLGYEANSKSAPL
jgi:Kiwa KwaB-like protein